MERVGRWARKEANDAKSGSDEATIDLAKELAAARDQTDEAARAENNRASSHTTEQLKLMEEEALFNVDGWEFSSEFAIQTEYTENHNEGASIF